MRFAGQRFRSPRQGMPKFKAERGQAESGRAPYANPTGTSAMTNMREVNAQQMAFTSMPDMSNPQFRAQYKSEEPTFKAPSRI